MSQGKRVDETSQENTDERRWWIFAVVCWIVGAYFLLAFLNTQGWWLPRPLRDFPEGTYLFVGLILWLLPVVKELNLPGLGAAKLPDFKKERSEPRREVPEGPPPEPAPKEPAAQPTPARSAEGWLPPPPRPDPPPPPADMPSSYMRKVLRTLWMRQVANYPDLGRRWTFRLGERHPEFEECADAIDELQRMYLVAVNGRGYVGLPDRGLCYCADHFRELGDDMWFEGEPSAKALQRAREVVARLRASYS